jgi:hypothetical protein
VLGAIVDHGSPPLLATGGSQAVAGALEAAFQAGRCDLLALSSRLQQATVMVEVPAALQGYQIEAASPEDYDVLLAGGVR